MASTAQEIFDEMARRAPVELRPQISEHVHSVGQRGVDFAIAVSPDLTGDFKSSWALVDLPAETVTQLPGVQLQNTDPGAVSIEYGTKDTPAHGTLVSAQVYMQSIAADEVHI